MLKEKILQSWPHALALVLIVLVNMIFFFPQFQGKVMNRSDAIQSYNMRGEFHEFEEAGGEHQPYYWNNSMFGGMPDKLLTLGRDYNVLGVVVQPSRLFIDTPAGVFIASMLVAYICMVLMGLSPWISLVGAFLFGLNTNHLILWETGHALKNFTIVFFPAIFCGLWLVTQKKYWKGGLMFAIGVSLAIYSNHPQMFYYLMMALGLFYLLFMIFSLVFKKVQLQELGMMSGVLIAGLVLGMMSNIAQINSTLSYGDVTMRGEPILKENKSGDPSSKVKGLDWDYSMGWSNGLKDVFSIFIPRAAGGGGGEEVGTDSAIGGLLKQAGQAPEADGNYIAPLYHGSLPFTSGALYMGALVILLFLISLFILPQQYGWSLGIAALFVALVSMGKNAEALNRFLFEYLPYYNKFRAPTSIFHGTGILFVIPGMMVLSKIVNQEASWKKVAIPSAILGIFTLAIALLGTGIIDFNHPSDQQYGPEVSEIFLKDRVDSLKSDAYRSFAIVLIAFLLIWAFLNEKIKSKFVVIAMIGLIGLVDLWGIGRRYLDEKDWLKTREYEANFTPRPVDKQIKKMEPKGRGYYRVHDLSINTYNSASTSYHHNTVGGYSAAKMQRIEDIIDLYLEKGHRGVLNMLNAKYVISPEQKVQTNNQALGNAWFVEEVISASSADEEVDQVGSVNLAKQAVVLSSEFPEVKAGDGAGNIEMVEYEPGYLKYQTQSESDQLAVFSEVWYPKYWEVTIDGEPANMLRANYLLRALEVPAGNHEVVFAFRPQASMGMISLLGSLLILGALIFHLYTQFQQSQESSDE